MFTSSSDKTHSQSRSKLHRTSIAHWLNAAVFAITLLTTARVANSSEFKVGCARRIITPDPLLPVSGGLGPTAPAREKQGELTARAVVYQQGETTVAIVGLDLLGFPSVLCDRVRTRIPRIPARNILIGSSHTHSAPDCYAFADGRGGHTGNLKYMDLVCVKAAEAVNEALDKLSPGRLKVATGEAKGKIAYNYYAPDLYDRRKVFERVVWKLFHHPRVGDMRARIGEQQLVPIRRRLGDRSGSQNTIGTGFVVDHHRLLE